MNVPDGVAEVRWAGRAKGRGGAPGPTDLEVVAWFSVDDAAWDAFAASLGPKVSADGASTDGGLVDRVVPADVGAANGHIPGDRYQAGALARSGWTATWLVRAEGGFVVDLHSR
jgi:hypothetical protein